MHPRAAALIKELDLQPHPEGGYYREIYRSTGEVQPLDDRSTRSALTTIYFLLPEGQQSRWHRVSSDEVWHFYEGEPLDLYWFNGSAPLHHARLSSGMSGSQPVSVVPAGYWQAARPVGSYSLVGCTVGPGFDFADFELISEESADWQRLRSLEDAPRELL